MEKLFPTVLMALDFFAAIPYAVKGDMKMLVYWIAAGVLTFSVWRCNCGSSKIHPTQKPLGLSVDFDEKPLSSG